MAKKKKMPAKRPAKKALHGPSKRLDSADYGIELAAIVEETRPHLTYAQVGERAGLKPMVVSHGFNRHRAPSLAAAAALAEASGDRLVVQYESPNRTGQLATGFSGGAVHLTPAPDGGSCRSKTITRGFGTLREHRLVTVTRRGKFRRLGRALPKSI